MIPGIYALGHHLCHSWACQYKRLKIRIPIQLPVVLSNIVNHMTVMLDQEILVLSIEVCHAHRYLLQLADGLLRDMPHLDPAFLKVYLTALVNEARDTSPAVQTIEVSSLLEHALRVTAEATVQKAPDRSILRPHVACRNETCAAASRAEGMKLLLGDGIVHVDIVHPVAPLAQLEGGRGAPVVDETVLQ